MSAINWLGAWLLFILILLALVQTEVGNTIAYYLLWLAVIFLLVSHYQQITDLFATGGITPNASA